MWKRISPAFKCLRIQVLGEPHIAEIVCHNRDAFFGGVDVRLHLAQRDGPGGQPAVIVENGIVRVFPSLLHQSVLGAPRVFHEAVAIAVAMLVDPLQGGEDVRPDFAQEIQIRRALVVGSGQGR